MTFVHLHAHSCYSLLDGACSVETMVARAAELGQPALALTEHGNLHSAYELCKQAKKHGIKPIIGCEFYVDHISDPKKQHHLTVLVQTSKGWENINRLTRFASFSNFYYKPRITVDKLLEHSEGLIVLSGCISSQLSAYAQAGDPEKARGYIELLLTKFIPDKTYYHELQPHALESQQKLNAFVIQLSREYGIPLVLTNDAHYAYEGDWKIRNALMANGMKCDLVKLEQKWGDLDKGEYSLRSKMEMQAFYGNRHGEPDRAWLDNTLKIAESIDFSLTSGKTIFPKVSESKVKQALEKWGKDKNEQYRNRLSYEFTVIRNMGFLPYFETLYTLRKKCADRIITWGPGRGSAAGSLVCYALNLTSINPIKHNLLFERFLNPDRVSLPDIDIDIPTSKRAEFLELIKELYGEDQVAQLATVGTLGGKSALKDAMRVYGVSAYEANCLTGKYPEAKQGFTVDLEVAIAQEPEIKEWLNLHPDVRDLALEIEGLVRSVGVHAGGVVISDGRSLDELVPVFKSNSAILPVTQFDMKEVEEIGLVKYDFLGLSALDLIAECEAITGTTAPWEDPTDPEVYKFLCDPHTSLSGVFQLESEGAQQFTKQLRPTNFNDLAAILALYRPGPMLCDPPMHLEYIERKHGRAEYTPTLGAEDILAPTHGVLVYQEQIMRLAVRLIGYTNAEADTLRKVIGKKEREKVQEHKDRWIKAGYAELWDQIETFAKYGFNASHSYAYAAISYATAYFKVHHRQAFIAASINTYLHQKDKLQKILREYGEEILSPTWESPRFKAVTSGNKVCSPLSVVTGLGEKALEELEKHFAPSLFELVQQCNRRVISKKIQTILEDLNDPHKAFELTGSYFNEHPLKDQDNLFSAVMGYIPSTVTPSQGDCYLAGFSVGTEYANTRKGDRFIKGYVYRPHDQIPFICWPSQLKKYEHLLNSPRPLLLRGTIEDSALFVEKVVPIDDRES